MENMKPSLQAKPATTATVVQCLVSSVVGACVSVSLLMYLQSREKAKNKKREATFVVSDADSRGEGVDIRGMELHVQEEEDRETAQPLGSSTGKETDKVDKGLRVLQPACEEEGNNSQTGSLSHNELHPSLPSVDSLAAVLTSSQNTSPPSPSIVVSSSSVVLPNDGAGAAKVRQRVSGDLLISLPREQTSAFASTGSGPPAAATGEGSAGGGVSAVARCPNCGSTESIKCLSPTAVGSGDSHDNLSLSVRSAQYDRETDSSLGPAPEVPGVLFEVCSSESSPNHSTKHAASQSQSLLGSTSTNTSLRAHRTFSSMGREERQQRLTEGSLRYRIGRIIGRGAYGTVSIALIEETGETVAVKKIVMTSDERRFSSTPPPPLVLMNEAFGEPESLESEDSSSDPQQEKQDLEARLNSLQVEVRLLKNLNHPNIVRYLFTDKFDTCVNSDAVVAEEGSPSERRTGTSQVPALQKNVMGSPRCSRAPPARAQEKGVLIFMEFVAGGSIAKLLNDFGPLTEHTAAVYAAQILSGLEYLHMKHVVHRDVKPANCLVTALGEVKLGDFGTALLHQTSDPALSPVVGLSSSSSHFGTPYYMAPEVIRRRSCTSAADIWSFGVTLVEMLTGCEPWEHLGPAEMTANEKLRYIAQESTEAVELPLLLVNTLSAELKDLLRHCLQRDPLVRKSATELLRHSWFAANEVYPTRLAGESFVASGEWTPLTGSVNNSSVSTRAAPAFKVSSTSALLKGPPSAEDTPHAGASAVKSPPPMLRRASFTRSAKGIPNGTHLMEVQAPVVPVPVPSGRSPVSSRRGSATD